MYKRIPVVVDSKYGTAGLLKGLVPYSAWHCNVLFALLCVGYLTAPPRYRGISLSSYWAWLRYGAAVSQRHRQLRLRPIWSQLDAHQKTIMSDDFGVGFPCCFLIEQHGFEDFADTNNLLDTLLSGIVSHASIPKRGPAKTPDLIGVDSADRLHVLECKGTQSSPEYLREAMEKGILQKKNLNNSSIFSSCMVAGIFVPQAESTEECELRFVDPLPDERIRWLQDMDPAVIGMAIRRQSFAKTLSAAGLWTAARAVDAGSVNDEEASFIRNVDRGELKFSGYDRGGTGDWQRAIEYLSLETDSKGEGGRRPTVTRLTLSASAELVAFLGEAAQENVKFSFKYVDEWLSERRIQRRVKRRRSLIVLDEERVQAPFRSTLEVTSALFDTRSSEAARVSKASIEMPFGLTLTLERFAF